MARLASDIAIDKANAVDAMVQQIFNLKNQVAAIVAENAVNPLGTRWATLTTTAVATDGAVGTVDGSPNAAHVIDPRVYASIARTVSPNDLAAALQVLVDFNTFCAGTQVNANAARPAQINAVAL